MLPAEVNKTNILPSPGDEASPSTRQRLKVTTLDLLISVPSVACHFVNITARTTTRDRTASRTVGHKEAMPEV